MLNRPLVHDADLRWVHAPAGGDIDHHGQSVLGGEDHLGLAEADDMVQFLWMAARVGAHVDTASANDAEEEGGIKNLRWD